MSQPIATKPLAPGPKRSAKPSSPIIASRIAAAIFGGYAFTWGITSLGTALLVALGIDFHEAETAMLLIAFLVFLGVFLWAFAAPRLARVCAVLAGGATLMLAAAWGLQKLLLS